jgi:ATP-dependent Clp protease ATP-binding subunit ClpC
MFERFTEGARQVVVLAQEEARILKHNYIGTEHILLGLLQEEQGLAARVLASYDVTGEGVRADIVRRVGIGDEVTPGQIPFTPRARRVLELAHGQRHARDHSYIGTEHILLGLPQENEGVAVHILLDSRADLDDIHNDVIRMLGRTGGPSPSGASERPGQESPDAPSGAAASFPGQLSEEELEEMIDMLRRQDRSLRATIDILSAELEGRRQSDDP